MRISICDGPIVGRIAGPLPYSLGRRLWLYASLQLSTQSAEHIESGLLPIRGTPRLQLYAGFAGLASGFAGWGPDVLVSEEMGF